MPGLQKTTPTSFELKKSLHTGEIIFQTKKQGVQMHEYILHGIDMVFQDVKETELYKIHITDAKVITTRKVIQYWYALLNVVFLM